MISHPRTAALLLGATALTACAHPLLPGTILARTGDEISVCGQLYHIDTPVVLWNDPGGYDAYRVTPRFGGVTTQGPLPPSYGDRRQLPTALEARVNAEGWRVADLADVVQQVVIHYDAAGSSRQCFKVLHDVRGLSSHFLVDVDGTIYQTLDLKERAWHAGDANDHSIGIEIAHIGAFDSAGDGTLLEWYGSDRNGPFVQYPAWMTETGIRTTGFVPRPARRELQEGVIHGVRLYQYDFTDKQYEALAKLVAGLAQVLPKIALEAPRDSDGAVLDTVMRPEQRAIYRGLLGHWHVSHEKRDPGPAFDWDRLLETAARYR